ncbi:Alpha/Beta hydrolase protein [Diaporthe amygdali]|uniref:Alpha/Beta hydrolase protein n=1 Tax=Phomopsis amygdali TaxID=1214568 RepID=UPI0022FE1824|nr:Alpha/Beta hydrolase protein [Diaporthe amygdali]KAJ0107185.1 Alpha/Beta hydrolase protein [Diaporthe amygdali]
MTPAVLSIQSATLVKSDPCNHYNDFLIEKLHFDVPLRHDRYNAERLLLVAHMVYGEALSDKLDACDGKKLTDPSTRFSLQDRPIILYLCGGPGADNPPCRVPDMNRWLLNRGYQILYVDYRGCGESSPVNARILKKRGMSDMEMANYIKQFCQDNIVRDLEAIRLCLSVNAKSIEGEDSSSIKWTVLGQSYGGYISLTYLSTHPEGLLEVFITGGLPPCGMDIKDYFKVEYTNIVAQNKTFYAMYPDAARLVRSILQLIAQIGPRNIHMTGRGYMTGQKLLTLGRQFGSKVGFPEVYNLLQRMHTNLSTTGKLSPETIREFEGVLHVDERPLYPILLEQTWCSEGATRWAAERVASKLKGFEYLRMDSDGNYPDPAQTPHGLPIYFTANTYCKFHYDTHEELIDLKGAAQILAEHPWECSYDFERLAENQLSVPVYAMSFVQDMHLDLGVAEDTAAKVGGLILVEDAGWHQDIRHKPSAVLEKLFGARDTINEASGKAQSG